VAQVIADAGPLLTYFDRSAVLHGWVREQFKRLNDPLLTCQAVVSEALFLMRRDGLNPDWLLEMIELGDLLCRFEMDREIANLRTLFRQYDNLPVSLADACLVRMSELHHDSVVFTLDRDFLVYRRNGRQKIPLLAPFA